MQFLPKQIKIKNPSKFINITIQGEEYRVCDYFSKKMWVNNKKSKKEMQSYNDGILNTKKDRFKTERIGRLGEMALSKIINKPVNFNYIKNGDDTDFIVGNKNIEIKTASHNYGRILVRRKTSKGCLVPIKFDVIVGAYLLNEDKENCCAQVCLVGYQYKKNIIKLPLENAIRGQHKNISIAYSTLKPFFSKKKGITMQILVVGKPISNKKHGAEVGVIYALETLGYDVSIYDLGTKSPMMSLDKQYDFILCLGAGLPPKMIEEQHPIVRKLVGNFSILWNSEPIRLPNYYNRVKKQKELFNLHATFDDTEMDIYENMGCNIMFLPQAGHPLWYKPLEVKPKKFACFIGSVGGKWKNRVHFLDRVKSVIPKEDLTITTNFDATKVNEIYNAHHLVLNVGLYHSELGPPTKMMSFGFQQRVFEAHCAGVPCLTNYPDPITKGAKYKDMFTNMKDIIYYDNDNLEAILKYLYQNKNVLLQMRNNIDTKKHTYEQRMIELLTTVEEIR